MNRRPVAKARTGALERAAAPSKAWAWLSAALFGLLLTGCGGGGGGGGGGEGAVENPAASGPRLQAAQLALLVAEGDATSEAIALAYQQARGIPAANIVRLPVSTASDVISATAFAALKASLDARLSSQIQATLVTWSRPSRVQGATCSMGLTSALAFGYSAAHCFGSDGSCSRTPLSPYFNSASHQPFSDHGMRPSMMLGAATLADAQAIINRGLAADASLASGSNASGHAWLLRTSDTERNVRWPDMQLLAIANVPGITMHYVDNSNGGGSNFISGRSNVMFYFTGLAVVPQLASNSWRPGAVGDSLTSSAGVLPLANGQTPVTAWLQAGATASYGTVEEPCNLTEKFPSPRVLVTRYQRGDTLIEAYWKSVQMPGQGLFVGEPLARPWGH